MNPQMEAAYRAIAEDTAKAKEAALADNARAQVVMTARMRLAQSEEFAEFKHDAEQDIKENESLLYTSHTPYLFYRAQGAVWALQTLLDRYENAEAALKHLETQAQETTPE